MLAVFAVMVLSVAGWSMFRPAQTDGGQFETTNVSRGDLQLLISAAGTVTPKETVEVGAQVSGQLQTLLVEAGDQVEVGQLVAKIDPTLAETQVEADRAQLKETRASYAQQEAQLELAQLEYNRAVLLRENDAIAQAELDTAQAELKVAKAQLLQLSAQIERQNSTLKSDLAELEYTNIYAPMTGTVLSLSAAEGQTLNANQSAPTILTIADLSTMTVEADVSEADVLSVVPGQKAYFTTLGDSETKWQTIVRQVLPEPEVVNDVVLYKALLDVENPDQVLKPEMTTQVFFISGETENALIIPVTALKEPPSQSDALETRESNDNRPDSGLATKNTRIVLVVDPRSNEVRPQQVTIGLQTRTKAEITSGLVLSDTIVTGETSLISPDGNKSTSDRPPGPPPF